MLKGRQSKKGFTLIELLVVVAIIIILAMILMSAFLKAQEKAKQAMCIAHGRQLGMATLMYKADYDEVWPIAVPPPWNSVSSWTWKHGRADGTPRGYTYGGYPWWPPFTVYVKDTAMWICPNAHWYYGERYAIGYKCSWIPRTGDWSGGPGNDPGWGGRTDKQIEQKMYGQYGWDPKRTSLDRKAMWHCYATRDYGPLSADLGLPYCSHADGSVYVYMDGHAGYAQLARTGFFPVNYPYN
jgi:prepilin-type N-terminal cleavage/methylation domain-containing protein